MQEKSINATTHFAGIDGLRAWLAWTVVFSHIVHMIGAELHIPFLSVFSTAGNYAVFIFIIISGFVITNLLLVKKEPFTFYIWRRFLRIYPVYLVCLALGIWGTYLTFDTLLAHPWNDLTPPTDRLLKQFESLNQENGLFAHLLAHLSLFHGVISTNTLYESQYMFLSPAWSLSLEWQFYLAAPFILILLRSHMGRIISAIITLVGIALYHKGLLGSFMLPSILPGAGLYFAIGIITRLAWPDLKKITVFPTGALIITVAFALFSKQLIPFIVWTWFVAYMLLEQTADSRQQTADSRQQTADSRQHEPLYQEICKLNVDESNRSVHRGSFIFNIPCSRPPYSDYDIRRCPLFTSRHVANIRAYPRDSSTPHPFLLNRFVSIC